MKIVSRLFDHSFVFQHRKNIGDDCFEYYYNNSQNKQLYYWINWSSEPVKLSSRFTGVKSEYYGANLFDKMLLDASFEYNKVSIIDKNGSVKTIPRNKKSYIANIIAKIILNKPI